MWSPTAFVLSQNVPVVLWHTGPSSDEKYWTLKRIHGLLAWESFAQAATTICYWWIVKGQLDSSGNFFARMEDPFVSAQAEDSFLDWRRFFLPANDLSPTTVDVPFYTHADVKTQRRLIYPERIALMAMSTQDNVEATSFFRCLFAKP